MPVKGKLKPGDTILLRAEVTRVAEDGSSVTLRVPGYSIPVTLDRFTLDESAGVMPDNKSTGGRT